MNRSGLLGLVRGVRAYFAAQEINAVVAVGWNKRNRIDNQGPSGAARVVFIPGEFDPTSGAPKVLKGGAMDRNAPQDHVALNPRLRTLAWWHETVTVCVWAVDPLKPQDEESQIGATEGLRELTLQAIHNSVDPETGTGAGFANIEEWGDTFWTLPPGEAGFGREITFSFTLLVPIFDQPIALAFPGPAVSRDPTS